MKTRLHDITLEFGRLLRAELSVVAGGGVSRYLTRKTSHVLDGPIWSTDLTDRLERLEVEIRSLGSKLADRESEQVLGVLDDFSEQATLAPDQRSGGETRIARQLLIAMGDEWYAN